MENPAATAIKEALRTNERLTREEEQKIKNAAQAMNRLADEHRQLARALALLEEMEPK